MVSSKSQGRTVRVLRGGQITIPIDIRRELGIEEDTLLDIAVTEDGGFVVHPVDVVERSTGSAWLREAYVAFAPVRQEAIDKGYTDEEINEWIDEAIREVRTKHPRSRAK